MAIQNPVRIQVTHSDPLMAAGLTAVLSQSDDVLVVAERAQIVITDYASGVSLARHCTPTPQRILIVTYLDKEWQIRTALAAGVKGYLTQSCSADELISAIDQLQHNNVYLPAQMRCFVSKGRYQQILTCRENDVLQLLATGRCNKAIARDLGIEVGTVKSHLKGVMTKLGATARTHAVVLAGQLGLLDQRGAAN